VIWNASVHNLFESNTSVLCDVMNTVEPGYNDIGLSGTSYIPSNIMSYQLTANGITPRLEQHSFITQNIQSFA
jgi:hypothetical protein